MFSKQNDWVGPWGSPGGMGVVCESLGIQDFTVFHCRANTVLILYCRASPVFILCCRTKTLLILYYRSNPVLILSMREELGLISFQASKRCCTKV